MKIFCLSALVFLAIAIPGNTKSASPKILAQAGPAPSSLCGNPGGLANYYSVPYPAKNSPALTALVQCITTNIPNPAMIDMGQIYTFQRDPDLINYTRGYRDCGLDALCASVTCHEVFSCHYGGRTGTSGAEAVDFNARAPFSEADLNNAIHTLVFPGGACFNLAKFITLEGDHTHLTSISNVGCDTTNIPITATLPPGPTTTPATTTTGKGSAIVPEQKVIPPLLNPIGCEEPICVVSNVLRVVLGSLGIIGLILFITGGFLILTSGGNVERIEKGKKTLVYAALGIVIIFLSWSMVYFLLNHFF